MKGARDAYLNLNVRGLGPSATLAIKERVRELRDQGRTVYDLGLGQSPFPVPEPVVEALRRNAREKEYLPVQGLAALREAVAAYHRRQDGLERTAHEVLIGPGSKELLFLLQLTFYGELVLPTPCWVSYGPQAQIAGRRVTHLETRFEDRWRLSPERLADHCEAAADPRRPRVLVLNYPANPHGCTYTSEELRALADVAREYEVLILSDEIYGELHHEGEHVSIARHYAEGTIVSSGLSKWCGAGGWRLGTFTFPPELSWLQNAMAAVASETYTSVSTPIQHAAVEAFGDDERMQSYLAHCRRILGSLTATCATALAKAGARVHPADGAFYLFPDLSPLADELAAKGIEDGPTLCRRLLDEAGVAALPGLHFERARNELTARIATVDLDGAKALAASEALGLDAKLPDDFVRQHCGATVAGVEAMADWLSDL